VGVGLVPLDPLRWHLGAMGVGECLTDFFAVWTVHRGCDAHEPIARTWRGWLKNFATYHMFFHLERHPFPAVPTRRLPELAERIDRTAPELPRQMVF
jgi:fatty acid desaturase